MLIRQMCPWGITDDPDVHTLDETLHARSYSSNLTGRVTHWFPRVLTRPGEVLIYLRKVFEGSPGARLWQTVCIIWLTSKEASDGY